MSSLCTFPGRHGDLLWALPTVRAIAQATGGPVDLQICGEFAGLVPLLQQQPYLGQIIADPTWGIGAGWRPPTVEAGPHDRVFHLGYRRWPELPLPLEVDQTVRADIELPPLELDRPWIEPPPGYVASWRDGHRIALGWTECYFELKYGLSSLLGRHHHDWSLQACMGGGRWETEGDASPLSWVDAAVAISTADLFLGDCSALHVLAVAMGTPVVMVEPMEARWNPIFYPCGKSGGQVTLVIGGDGQPTFDARHTADTITARLAHLPAKGR